MKKLFFILIAIVAVVTVSLLPVQAKMVMKAGHISPKTSIEGKAADKFAELVAQKTNGEIVVEVFPSEQLGKAPTMIDSTILGNQDIYIGGNVEFEKFSPGLRVGRPELYDTGPGPFPQSPEEQRLEKDLYRSSGKGGVQDTQYRV